MRWSSWCRRRRSAIRRKARSAVTMIEVRPKSRTTRWKRSGPPDWGEGQTAESRIEDDEVHAGEVIGEPARLARSGGFGSKPIDEIDDIVGSTARAGANAVSCNGDGGARASCRFPFPRRARNVALSRWARSRVGEVFHAGGSLIGVPANLKSVIISASGSRAMVSRHRSSAPASR